MLDELKTHIKVAHGDVAEKLTHISPVPILTIRDSLERKE
jgi:predicted transcriptional regulator